jgi:hypothetical protein
MATVTLGVARGDACAYAGGIATSVCGERLQIASSAFVLARGLIGSAIAKMLPSVVLGGEQRHYARKFPSDIYVHISARIYLSVLSPPNTTFLAPPCFLGIVNLGSGTPTSAILSGGW